jgi:molybdopterin molybdotransferase
MALKNDCFALPPGIEWTPVPEALTRLRERIEPIAAVDEIPLADALGRVLARDAVAQRSTPPHDNAAVDGYAVAHASLTPEGEQSLVLLDGRAAAGAPFVGAVPLGHAVRTLTGAVMPEGTDSVVMQEDVTRGEGGVTFGSGLKPGANRRKAGEDIATGETAIRAGRRLGAADLAQAASVGLARLAAYRPLRVALFSTGDELCDPGEPPALGAIYDANRPMLAGLARAQGFEVIDKGRIPDDAASIRTALTEAAAQADAVVTSGGASGGDEDHIARALTHLGAMAEWRIAMKPGRPLAMGQIGGVPVFGLPGNPVAAFVCFLMFARPALLRLGGADWPELPRFPVTITGPAKKRAGRTEYLRGRYIGEGKVEKFRSEGSGLISGLRWSDGLIELSHNRDRVEAGEAVDYIPYSAFGL